MIEYTDVKDPEWTNEHNTSIKCLVKFTHTPWRWTEFVVASNDIVSHSKEIYDRIINGDFGDIKPYS